MRLQTVPALAEVRALPRYLVRTVPESFLDQNEHMNIQHYLGLYDEAGLPFLDSLGIDRSYFVDRRLGVFDLEHHLWYLDECHAGDQVAVYGRMLGRSDKRMHAVWFLVNETRERLSNVFEFITSHADLNARRTAPFPPDVTQKLDAMIDEHRALGWTAPTCGIMSP